MKDLEGVGRNGLSRYSPFVVIDHLALIWHLALVREIVHARKFAVIIPSAGKQRHDFMPLGNKSLNIKGIGSQQLRETICERFLLNGIGLKTIVNLFC